MSTSRVMMAIPHARNDHKPRELTSRQILTGRPLTRQRQRRLPGRAPVRRKEPLHNSIHEQKQSVQPRQRLDGHSLHGLCDRALFMNAFRSLPRFAIS